MDPATRNCIGRHRAVSAACAEAGLQQRSKAPSRTVIGQVRPTRSTARLQKHRTGGPKMGIAKKAIKTAAWVKAPKLMFAKRNPKKAAFLAAAGWVTNRVLPQRRKKTSLTRTAVQGLGAAAVALPLGLWVGRKARGAGQ
jgi:hypothetical protein